MSTKAAYLELVSDLTTKAFLTNLKHFFSQCRKSTNIFSNNGFNFIGASGKLNEVYAVIKTTEHKNLVQ